MSPYNEILSMQLLGYIGPGGGMALMGALLGVIFALGSAVFMVVLWPLRRMMKKSRIGGQETGGQTTSAAESPSDAQQTPA